MKRQIHRFLLECFVVLALGCSGFAQDHYTSLSFKYDFLHAEGANGQYTNFNGWDFVPTYKLSKRLGVFASISGLYGGVHQNIHGYTAGPSYSFPNSTRFTPVVFTEAGVSRSSKPGAITNSFAYALGALVSIKLNKHVNLIVEPAEYSLSVPNGSPRNNYVAEFGFSFPVGKQK